LAHDASCPGCPFSRMQSRRSSHASNVSRESQPVEVPEEEDGEDIEAVWARREAARMRQIMIGKARPEYRRYLAEVLVEDREPTHPCTPNPRDRVSKRQFDRALGDWRRKLHEFDAEMGFVSEFSERPGSTLDGPVQPGAMPSSGAPVGSYPQPPTRPPSFAPPQVSQGESPPMPASGQSALSPPTPPPQACPIPQVPLAPLHPPPSQPPVVDAFCPGIVQLRLADQLPAPAPAAPHQAAEFVPQAAQTANPEFPVVDYASAAAIGIAAAVAALVASGQMPGQQMTGPMTGQMPQMCSNLNGWAPADAYDPTVYVPAHPMDAMVAPMPPPPVPVIGMAPETPCRLRPVSFEDRETPPPLPFQMQASSRPGEGYLFQAGQLGAVSEECEKVKLTYEDVTSPRNTSETNLTSSLAIPKEDVAPPFTPQRRKVPCSPPSSVAHTPCPGPWVMETPSPQNCSSHANYAFFAFNG